MTRFQIRIAAINDQSEGPASDPIIFHTGSGGIHDSSESTLILKRPHRSSHWNHQKLRLSLEEHSQQCALQREYLSQQSFGF